MKLHQFVDFEDLIFKSIQLLKTDPQARQDYLDRFDHIFIDEYQDINTGQYQLIRLLAGSRANVCVIGDPDQSIYGFRGSDTDCFKWFLTDYPDADVIYLRRNYRSTQTILDVSAQVIEKNPDMLESGHRRAVYSTNTGRRTIQLMASTSAQAEAVAIGKTIEKMVGGTGFFSLDSGAVDGTVDTGSFSFSDFAVLFRTRSQADPILQILEKAGIPCQFIDRRRVLDHQGIKSILSVFRLISGTGMFDDLYTAGSLLTPSLPAATVNVLKSWAFNNSLPMHQALLQSRRLPIPGMALSRQQRLYAFINRISDLQCHVDGMPVVDSLSSIADMIGVKQTHADDPAFDKGYQKLTGMADAAGTDAPGFMADVSLCRDTDTYDHRVEKVSLMTLHAAKGLEFPVVFISGCEDGWIPYQSTTRPTDPEEERRLFYVGLTRAERHLFLTHATTRLIHGRRCERQRSPFVKDIEKRYIQMAGPQGNKHCEPIQRQLSLF